MKFYVSDLKKLNWYELNYGVISYGRLIKRHIRNMVLCNNIANETALREKILENWIDCFEELDEETKEEYNNDWAEYYEGTEIFQYYVTDLGAWDYKYLCEYGYKDCIVYSTTLDCYVLLVTHFGTSWDYVLTNVKWTNNWDECEG